MNVLQSMKMAWKQLKASKLRSFLTMLGIIIGVASVILLVSLGNGVTQEVDDQMGDLGSNLITVVNSSVNPNDKYTYDEVMKYQNIDGVKSVSPELSGQVNATFDYKSSSNKVIGTNDQYKAARSLEMKEGRFLLPIDTEYGQKVAVIGSTVASDLFGFGDPIGETIRLNGMPYKVVGVLKEKGASMMGSSDDQIFIPISSAQRLLKDTNVRTIYVETKSAEDVDFVVNTLESRLAIKFGDEKEQEKNASSAQMGPSYQVINQQEILNAFNTISTTLTTALGAIAAISLVVGGIGIMNIMLVSVSERTREIGIRKALGAKKRAILLQFLIESIVISVCGGVIGIIIGVSGALIFGSVAGISSGITAGTIIFSFVFSLCIGVIFGIAPANKASKLRPIDALRSE
ncbi:TPA: ABC transporter permease [Listeria monocytogenes]|uniref:FtsX-like permease family protein n=10 Tax=Listeria monocytogenes TaxID=1639 RepID=A0A9P2DS05_LISMN|nr:ABC transporter permease [Listeria monocytogenes]EAA0165468.1 FtsX-like permease family protein [Listeria monocytogenes serotype 1/2a]EAD3237047.1 FtsX-like permease family protein [Listeria monocytogenes CFSAN002202]EAE6023523.1 FtsX-like permease family protein [Listeria monocytogenes serotype 3a]EAF4505459.1 FtsX-like permease family protein [Listeria monocytogenes serotype 4b]EAG6272000.1 FtsX-like permease family protein [Listeria monocytogenes CFSAN003726]EAG6275268.1 FtsX-like perme